MTVRPSPQRRPLRLIASSAFCLGVLALLGATSGSAHAATACMKGYNHRSGNVADRAFYTTACPTRIRRGVANAWNVRPVRNNGDRVCVTAVPVPRDRVVTSQFYSPQCGRDHLGRHNTGTLYKPYNGIRGCLGYPVPSGYVISGRSLSTACGNVSTGRNNVLTLTRVRTSSSNGAPSSSSTSSGGSAAPSSTSAPAFTSSPSTASRRYYVPRGSSRVRYLIRRASDNRVMYSGYGGRYVNLASGRYTVYQRKRRFWRGWRQSVYKKLVIR